MTLSTERLLHWPCRGGGEGGEPHGTSRVIAQGVGYKRLPPLGQLHVGYEAGKDSQTWEVFFTKERANN